MERTRPALSIALPLSCHYRHDDSHMPKTPEAQQCVEAQSATEPPPPPRPQPFKVKRKRPSAPFQEPIMLDTNVIPTIEMSEVPTQMSSPTMQPTSAHLLSPIPISSTLHRAFTPPKTPAPKLYTSFSQLESPMADEWDLINNTKPAFQRAGSVCSTFSDSSVSSCGSSAFSMPTGGGYDSPQSDATDPFMDDDLTKHDKFMSSPQPEADTPQNKRIKTRRNVTWTPQMDDHLWMTFMAYLSDPTLTPFKMLPGSTPPMGVCDQVATKAKRTWRPRKVVPVTPGSIDALLEAEARQQREGSPDTIRPSTLQVMQAKWPKSAATRRRLRELCARRPSISAHYQRMLRTRSPSPFETSSPATSGLPLSSSFSNYEMMKTLVTSTAPSMQPDSMLAQLAGDEPPPAPKASRPPRPEGWFDRIPRSKAHQKSASLQSELKIHMQDMDPKPLGGLHSPFDAEPGASRSRLLRSMANTKSLGRTEFNGKSLDSPFDFKVGASTDRRSRKRRFRSDEEKPRRPVLTDDIFGPPVDQQNVVRGRGFSVGAVRATDNLSKLCTPPSISMDHEMPDISITLAEAPSGSRSAPRRLVEPVPRLGSPFMETPPPRRQQHNTFPRSSLLPSMGNQEPFHQRLLELANQHAGEETL
ncbi:uncharacterized protein MYCFIDRAFT_215966 [Pseudocercospora fijiensis CIRAD86]|uniref:Uncharacterized protein n=1 Tax=Pseudocercospora fijiensis (strain CIRAD86) TaxID=383855 RepID=M2ZQV9_PSEFD|nr:uncharacterized protein MYCFIDRAFT_215966 [Pseudocercospora fijiensis CIRAD86]EME81464.1 hypothetical protein MYCFIDRAFT_215966 [Pseudocercospora fijiensis CIRAD86]